MNKNIKSIFFLLTIIILLCAVGAVSATDDTNNSISDITTSADTSSDSTITELQTTHNEKQVDIKSIEKENKNTKTESKTITLNSNNFKEYVTDGKFNDNVTEGDTIDIQGKLDDPKFALDINKPVNMISSTGDAYIDLNTISLGTSGDYKNGMFQITSGSEGTNITNITFHNTRIWVTNTNNVHIENITVICEKNTGSGVGSFSIRGSSQNINVTNSYFKTIHNGGHSNVVVAGATNCLFENNTVEAWGTEGNVGNTFYLTTYGGEPNTNITIRNNTIRNIIPENVGMAICWGLVLEGKGHIIENNYLSGASIVKAQYADSEYGVVTNIEDIIFRNNYVEGRPELMFTGLAYNNTITSMARLGNIKAYNNSFETANLTGNTLFENNTAKKIIVEGNNNTLNNNEVYSEEDYAVLLSGENNTLTNNKLLSKNGYGEDTISNSTEYVSVNNSEKMPRIFYITDDNILDYFNIMTVYEDFDKSYRLKEDVIDNGDILVFNMTPQLVTIYTNKDLTFENARIDNLELIIGTIGNVTIKNSNLAVSFGKNTENQKITIINSTIYSTKIKNVIMENSEFLSDYPKNNTYILCSYFGYYDNALYDGSNGKRFTIFDNEGHILNTVNSSSKILVRAFDDSDMFIYNGYGETAIYKENIFIDKSLNFVSVEDEDRGHISSNVHLVSGSAETTFNGITFDGNVLFETDNIEFYNCTFNRDLVVNQNYIIFDGCTFNGKVTLNSSNNNIFNNNTFKSTDSINILNSRINTFENNTVNTSEEYTIIFDDDSNNNIVRFNNLVASSSFGDYSVTGGDNIIEDNYPAYNTQIIINAENQYLADINPEITVTVTDIDNNMPVTKGYVEVYYDGYFIDKKDLVNGQTTVILPSYLSGNYPIKVWYYDGIKYNNNVTKVNVDIIKSNVTISVDEFTAKLNEKASTNITFLNQKGNPVQDTNVTVNVGRTTYTIETINGVASLDELVTSEWLNSGKMTINIPDTDMYNRNSTTVTLNTSKDDVTPTITFEQEDNEVTVNMELVDSLNNPVSDGKITITTIDGTQLNSSRIRNGTYNSTITLPEDYTENLIINYTNSYYYNDFTQELELQYNIIDTITKITLPEIGITNTPIEIKATVTDNEETPLTNGTIIFTINDQIIAQSNIINGTAITTITLTQEENVTIKATYQKTKDYRTSSDEATITIQKPITNIEITDVELTAGETVTLTATVTDQAGNNINGGKVTFKVNGKTVKDANGKVVYAKVVDGIATAEYTVPDNLSGQNITITATYSGSTKHNKETATLTTSVATPEPTLTITPITDDIQTESTITLKAKLTLGDNAINTGKIVFKINGKTVKDTNGKVIYAKVDSNGEVSIDYTLPESYKAGTYTLTATFIASGYDKLEASETLTIV